MPYAPKYVFFLSNVLATAIQMPPVPPWAGKRNVALGPQVLATLLRVTFFVSNLTLGAATRSPSQVEFIWKQGSKRHGYMVLESLRVHTYLSGRNGPNLEVVRTHEDLSQTLSHISDVPFIKVLGLVRGVAATGFQCGVNQAIQAFRLLLLGQYGDVVLERIGNPLALITDVRDALVRVPVGGIGQSFIETVVEVLVVREDDMPTNIEQLWAVL